MESRTPPSGSYPVLFRIDGEAEKAGSLRVTDAALVLDGGAAGSRATIRVPFGELRRVRIARTPAERMNGNRVLVLERVGERAVHVAPLGPGLLHEIGDLVSTLSGTAVVSGEPALVSVALKPGAEEEVRELVAGGPPFEPRGLGLVEHRVLLQDGQVVFVFVGVNVRDTIERAMRNPSFWRAGFRWRRVIASAPKLLPPGATQPVEAEVLYEWPETRAATAA